MFFASLLKLKFENGTLLLRWFTLCLDPKIQFNILRTMRLNKTLKPPSLESESVIKFRKCGKLDDIKEIAPHIKSPLSKRQQHYVKFI